MPRDAEKGNGVRQTGLVGTSSRRSAFAPKGSGKSGQGGRHMDAGGDQAGSGRDAGDRNAAGNRGPVLKRRAFLGMLLAVPALASAHPAPAPAPAPAPIKDAELAARSVRRHRVALPAAEFVVRLANAHFPESPDLLLALIGVESHYNVWCRGAAGEVGL